MLNQVLIAQQGKFDACWDLISLPENFNDGLLLVAVLFVGLVFYGLDLPALLHAGAIRRRPLILCSVALVLGVPALLQVAAAGFGMQILGWESCQETSLVKLAALAALVLSVAGSLPLIRRPAGSTLMFSLFGITLLAMILFLQTFYRQEVLLPCCGGVKGVFHAAG